MKKIIGYAVVYANSIELLQNRVFEAMENGFQPQGGISHDGTKYLQAMVCYSE